MESATKPRVATQTNRAYKKGWDILARAKVLAMEDRKDEIINEVRRYFSEAIKYNFNELVAELAKYQYYYFLHNLGNRKRAEKFKAIHKKYNYLTFVENEVVMEFANISNKLNNTRTPSKQLRSELTRVCEEFRPHIELGSASINIWIYMLLIAEAYLELDYKKVLTLCQEIIEELESKGIERTSHFYKDASLALILMERYSEAAACIKKALSTIKKGKNTWALFAFYQVLVELHKGDYDQAYEYYLTRNNSKIINRQLKEQWLILCGYFKFLSQQNILPGLHSFKIGKFLNSTPIFDRDKSGNNINILILQMLIKGKDWVIDKEDSIRKYMSQHMKSPELKRAKYLLKFLISHAKHSYHPEALNRHALPLLQKLKTIPLTSQNLDIEIIPYDVVGEIMLRKKTARPTSPKPFSKPDAHPERDYVTSLFSGDLNNPPN